MICVIGLHKSICLSLTKLCFNILLNGTSHFVLILAVPVDKGSSVSPNVRLYVSSASLSATRRLLH